MNVCMFQPSHLNGFALQDAQAAQFESREAWHANAKQLAAPGRAFTLKRANGEPVAIAGLYGVDPGYSLAWAFVARDVGAAMVPMTRIVRRYLDNQIAKHRRIEMTVHVEFEDGIRWAHHLGFAAEGTMRAAAPDGGDLIRFVRIRGDYQ